MNIKQAKEEIKNAMTAYFSKDSFGDYLIPIERQRPIFLMGAPGIGKTAIMEQIASELGVGLVSYSMTHHTRQSALGLPYIVTKKYGSREYSVSEYTMSEIIASVYDMIEATGLKEGILFLDEINCVSETLAPSMLQFLQYKIFGRHRVPDGWIVVTAGNPPEYNNSVREFDIVTLDRLKRIDVEPDYGAWKEYAVTNGIHPSVSTYLDIKKGDFYLVESTVDGKSFVTARGWSDLSDMIKLYEQKDIPVTESLVVQYLQNKRIAKDFAVYYDLFNKYRSDYQVDSILSGTASFDIKQRARMASFDERLSLLGLMLDSIAGDMRDACLKESSLKSLLGVLKALREELAKEGADPASLIAEAVASKREELDVSRTAGNLSVEDNYVLRSVIASLEDFARIISLSGITDPKGAFSVIKEKYDASLKEFNSSVQRAKDRTENAFAFADDVFPSGQELLILVTELTVNGYCARFISHHGCDGYFAHNKALLFYERQKEIVRAIEELDLDLG